MPANRRSARARARSATRDVPSSSHTSLWWITGPPPHLLVELFGQARARRQSPIVVPTLPRFQHHYARALDPLLLAVRKETLRRTPCEPPQRRGTALAV